MLRPFFLENSQLNFHHFLFGAVLLVWIIQFIPVMFHFFFSSTIHMLVPFTFTLLAFLISFFHLHSTFPHIMYLEYLQWSCSVKILDSFQDRIVCTRSFHWSINNPLQILFFKVGTMFYTLSKKFHFLKFFAGTIHESICILDWLAIHSRFFLIINYKKIRYKLIAFEWFKILVSFNEKVVSRMCIPPHDNLMGLAKTDFSMSRTRTF